MEKLNDTNLDWRGAYVAKLNSEIATDGSQKVSILQEDIDFEVANMLDLQRRLAEKDGFIPVTVNQINPENIGNIIDLSKQIYQEEFGKLPYLSLYRSVIEKIAVLVAGQNADYFLSNMDKNQQETLFGWKMTYPTEIALLSSVYPELLGDVSGPNLFPGEDFAGMIKRLCPDDKLAEKLCGIHSEFVAEYLARKRQKTANSARA